MGIMGILGRDLCFNVVETEGLRKNAVHLTAVFQVGSPHVHAVADGTQCYRVAHNTHQRLRTRHRCVEQTLVGQETEVASVDVIIVDAVHPIRFELRALLLFRSEMNGAHSADKHRSKLSPCKHNKTWRTQTL